MKSKLIVALDVPDIARARRLVTALRDVVDIFKVGSQLFTRAGPAIVEFIHAQGKQCFLDLKFHDIPDTVARAVRSAAALRVAMLTVHASGGERMLRAAASVRNRPRLLAVTVLTSVAGHVRAEVLRLAGLARDCGVDGVVAAPQEVRPLRSRFGAEFLIVCPGIRPAGAGADDQRRVMTPGQAVAAGADYIVVGRPIIAARQPARAAARIARAIRAASTGAAA